MTRAFNSAFWDENKGGTEWFVLKISQNETKKHAKYTPMRVTFLCIQTLVRGRPVAASFSALPAAIYTQGQLRGLSSGWDHIGGGIRMSKREPGACFFGIAYHLFEKMVEGHCVRYE